MRLTVGPLPPAVYWRRRALVLGVALLVVFLVAQACMAASARSDKEDTAGAGPTPGPTGSSAPPESPAPDGQPVAHPTGEPSAPPESPADPSGQECADGEIVVTAEAVPEQVPQGGTVEVWIKIRNDSDRECRRDIGGSQRELFIREGGGAGKVWSSRDCTELTGNDVRDLEPGFETSRWAPWNTRTSDDCTELGEAAGALVDPGEYELVARLGTIYSEPVLITVAG